MLLSPVCHAQRSAPSDCSPSERQASQSVSHDRVVCHGMPRTPHGCFRGNPRGPAPARGPKTHGISAHSFCAIVAGTPFLWLRCATRWVGASTGQARVWGNTGVGKQVLVTNCSTFCP
eukprot:363513-Chlamydomonas_euryale.AAC.4